MDFSQYFDNHAEILQEETNTPVNQNLAETTQDTNAYVRGGEASLDGNENGMTTISMKDMLAICERLTGVNADGNTKGITQYQSYEMNDPDTKKNMIYSAKNARVGISIEPNLPGFFVVDLMFRSPDDTELKMLWGRLQQFFKNRTEHQDKDYIFYFNILERDSVTLQTEKRDVLMIMNIFNPLTAYLTREVPNMLSEEHVRRVQTGEAELYGGNILRMVCANTLISIQESSMVDTNQIKGEVQRERDADRYLNNQDNSDWRE